MNDRHKSKKLIIKHVIDLDVQANQKWNDPDVSDIELLKVKNSKLKAKIFCQWGRF